MIFTNQAGIGGKGFDNAKYKAISGKIEDLSAEVIATTLLIVESAKNVIIVRVPYASFHSHN